MQERYNQLCYANMKKEEEEKVKRCLEERKSRACWNLN
jgi:hypothetical protein